MNHRATDGPREGAFWVFARRLYQVWIVLVPAIAVLAACVAVFRNEQTIERVQETQRAAAAEIKERRDQTCRIFESQHLANVNRLKDTYKFLDNVQLKDRGTLLTRAVLDGLEALEEQARVDQAPPYCDEPGKVQEDLYERTNGEEGKPPIGLPEPDPIVPPRRNFDRLAQKP